MSRHPSHCASSNLSDCAGDWQRHSLLALDARSAADRGECGGQTGEMICKCSLVHTQIVNVALTVLGGAHFHCMGILQYDVSGVAHLRCQSTTEMGYWNHPNG